MHNSAQYHDLVPLDGKHKRGRACTGLTILLALAEVPWYRPNSFQATLEATLHTSWEWDRSVSLKSVVDIAETEDDKPDFEQYW